MLNSPNIITVWLGLPLISKYLSSNTSPPLDLPSPKANLDLISKFDVGLVIMNVSFL